MLKDLVAKDIDTLKVIYWSDFNIIQFNDLTRSGYNTLDEQGVMRFAVGLNNNLIFKKYCSGIYEIKTGHKIEYSYGKPDSISQLLSLIPEKDTGFKGP